MRRWLHVRLEAPLGAFGSTALDAYGFTGEMPALSMMTGLIGNALGWDRGEHEKLSELQERLTIGAVWDEGAGPRLTDYQTAELGQSDQAWTTSGNPLRRTSGPATFDGCHQRWRDYLTDLQLSIVVGLADDGRWPSIDDVASALNEPARPLFIGRKGCAPTSPLARGIIEAPSVHSALIHAHDNLPEAPASWPATQGEPLGDDEVLVADRRNWKNGFHSGRRSVRHGRIGGPPACS